MIIAIVVVSVIALIAIAILLYFYYKRKSTSAPPPPAQLNKKEDIDVLVKYVEAQKQEAEEKQRLKEIKSIEMKQKLETYKQTKEELRVTLKRQLDAKEWQPLKTILNKLDKGTMGIYILYNETKNKYYIGQSKEIFARIRKHFEIEQIAMDFARGDSIKVKILTANELSADYRIDHIEKTGIEIYDSAKNGYNKTGGNI